MTPSRFRSSAISLVPMFLRDQHDLSAWSGTFCRHLPLQGREGEDADARADDEEGQEGAEQAEEAAAPAADAPGRRRRRHASA